MGFADGVVKIAVVELSGQMRSTEEMEGRMWMAFVEGLVVPLMGGRSLVVPPGIVRAVALLLKKFR